MSKTTRLFERTSKMWKLKLCVVFVLGVVLDGVVLDGVNARRLADFQSQDDVGIIGGEDVDITQFPYQVSLVKWSRHDCGGSIISEQYVLTAAHCVVKISPKDVKIRAGSSDVHGGVLYDVESLVYHPKFVGSGNNYEYDIAVVKVSGKMEINGETIDVVRLADAGSELNTGDIVTVSGWGDTTGHGNFPNVLKATTLPVVDKNHCYEVWQSYNITISDNMLCAGFKEPKQSACYGDSGGPLVDLNQVQYGIVSLGSPGCQEYDMPNVYTYVPKFRDWILENTGV